MPLARAGGYSGVALFVSKTLAPLPPAFGHPPFDFEARIVDASSSTALMVASVYVPNGGKDFPAKMQFLEELGGVGRRAVTRGQPLVLCGDLNVAHTDRDLHPKERKAGAIGQRPESARCSTGCSAGAWSTSAARSIPTTRTCSRGGRHGGTCASATSAGASTTSWPATAWRHARRS